MADQPTVREPPSHPGHPAGWCLHYTAPNLDSDDPGRCAAGVAYSSLPRLMAERPCFLTAQGCSRPGAAPCAHLSRPTADDIALYNAWLAARRPKLVAALLAAQAWRSAQPQGKAAQAYIDCPACGGKNTLYVTIAVSNGHMSGHCKTNGCVSWME